MAELNQSPKQSFTVVKMTKRGYVLFFEDSLISLMLEKSFIKSSKKELKKKLKAEKVSVFKRNEAVDMFWEEFGNQYLAKTKEIILSENNDAVEFEYKDIEKFKLTPFRRNVKMGGSDTTPQDYLGEISVKTSDKKIWFNHKYVKEDAKYVEIKALKEKLGI